MTTSPFLFQNLPQVSRTENDLVVALQSLWQRMGFAQQLVPNLEQVIAKNTGLAAKLVVDRIFTTSIKPESGKDFLPTLPPAGAYVLLGLTPVSEKAIVEVDLQLAHVIIDRLLGGTGEPLGVIGPLSEVEEGVLSYFVLKLLAQIHEQAGGGTRLHFRLEEMAHSTKSWQAKVSGAFVVIFLTLSLGHRSGYLKLILPANLIQKGFLEAFSGVPAPEPRSGQEADLPDVADRYGFVPTQLRMEVGSTQLKGKDISGLAKGDVIFFDQSEVFLQDGKPMGHVALKVGRGGRPIPGTILSVDKRIEVIIL